jgi:hypothetical protein
MRFTVLVAVTMATLVALPAAAQISAAGRSTAIRPIRGMDGVALVERETWRKEMTRRNRLVNDPARKARAERAAAMINLGQCAEAHQMAVDEQDTDMAATIKKACQPVAAQ